MSKSGNQQLVENALKDMGLAFLIADGLVSAPGLRIGSTKSACGSVAYFYVIDSGLYVQFTNATGTALGSDVVPSGKYGAVALDIGIDGVVHAVSAVSNASGYDTAALARADIPGVASGHVRKGIVSAMKSDGDFTFGTTLLDAANTTVEYVDGSVGISLSGVLS